MLTRLAIRNFKLFESVEIDLGERVVFTGPTNAGKTTALQALALWEIGVKRWIEKYGAAEGPAQRPGVTVNRLDLTAVPVPAANQLWRDLHVRNGGRRHGKTGVENVLIDIAVDGIGWSCAMEFDYANEESFYCRPRRLADGTRMIVPQAASSVRIAYLPPMSGLVANEIRHDRGAINVRLGEGRTAEVLRNLCYQVVEGEDGTARWNEVVERIDAMFGSRLDEPRYVAERGEITMTYRTLGGVRLDLSASGRGEQQTLMLLAHMMANPGAVLLLDEPDAHLEVMRQRQIYQMLSEITTRTGSQIIAASHSEVLRSEAAERDVLVSFVGKLHRVDPGSSVQDISGSDR